MDGAMIDLHLALPTALQRSQWLSFKAGPTKNRVCPLRLSMMEETEKVPETLDFNSELMELLTQGYSSFFVAMEASSLKETLLYNSDKTQK
jgi:hypothetical protein